MLFLFIAERQAGKQRIPLFIFFGLTQPEIEPVFAVSVADALFQSFTTIFLCDSNSYSYFPLRLKFVKVSQPLSARIAATQPKCKKNKKQNTKKQN